MSQNFINIKDRVFEYINYKSIKQVDFFNKTGIASSNFRGKSRLSELGGDSIAKILTCYGDINAEWLITGEGPMLKTDQQIGDISSSTVVSSNVSGNGNQTTHNDFAGMIELQKGYQELLNRKDEQINRLLTIIENAQKSNMK